MPAMPPAERPCGRTDLAGKRSSWASRGDEDEVEVLAVGDRGTDDAVAVLEADDVPVVALGRLGRDPLDDAGRGAERRRRVRRRRSARSSPVPRPCRGRRRPRAGAPPERLGAPFVGGSVGRSSAERRTIRPALVTRPNSPRAVVRTAPMTTSCLEREPSAVTGSAVPVRASRPVERQQHPARVVGDLERRRGRGRRAGTRALEEHRAPRGAVRLGDVGELGRHELQEQLLVVEQGPQLLDGALELGLLGLELDARELREAAQLQVEDVGRLGLGQVEDVHEARARPWRRRRSCG